MEQCYTNQNPNFAITNCAGKKKYLQTSKPTCNDANKFIHLCIFSGFVLIFCFAPLRSNYRTN